MWAESIFHKLVKDENSYTQLLCNLMRRDSVFREAVLANLIDKDLREEVKAHHIHTQMYLWQKRHYGYADIYIETPNLAIIVEIKTDLHRGMTIRQSAPESRDSYVKYLKGRKRRVALVAFLVPLDWGHRPTIEQEYKDSLKRCGIDFKVFHWEDILRLIPRPRETDNPSLVGEFRLLLSERFGPVEFEPEEVTFMLDKEFPLPAALKLVALIEEVRKKAEAKGVHVSRSLDIGKEELGFGFEKNKHWPLWFGCWSDNWGEAERPAIGFYIERTTRKDSAPIEQAFRAAYDKFYGGEPTLAEDRWILGWVKEEDMIGPAADQIWNRLLPIWKAVEKAVALPGSA
jgi:hypothetical protein